MTRSSAGRTRRSGEEQSLAGLFHSSISNLKNQLFWSETLTGEASEAPRAPVVAMRHCWDIHNGVEEIGVNVDRFVRLGKTASSPRKETTLLIASGTALFGRRKQVPVGLRRNRFHKKRSRTSRLPRIG